MKIIGHISNTYQMRKGLSGLIALALILIPVQFTNAASPKAGATCPKFNQTQISSGYKFTCIKSGKKLVWSKGAKVVTTTTTTSPLPMPTPTTDYKSSPSPIPPVSPSPSDFIPPSLPTTFQDLNSHLSGIIYGSWLKASDKIRQSKSSVGNIQYLVGPNTTLDYKDQQGIIDNVSFLYNQFKTVNNLYLIEYNLKDIDWAQIQYESVKPTNYDPNTVKNQCASEYGCNGGFAGIRLDGDGLILYGQGSNEKGFNYEYRVLTGQTLAHEYTHTIQLINSMPVNGWPSYGMLPQWLLEGNAEWTATAVTFYQSYSKYLVLRNSSLDFQYKNSKDFTLEWIKTFLNPNFKAIEGSNNWEYWDKYDRWYNYAIGIMVNEILVSLKGPDSVMKLYEDSGKGMSFNEAFKKEFDLPWNEAVNYISQAIYSELKQGIQS